MVLAGRAGIGLVVGDRLLEDTRHSHGHRGPVDGLGRFGDQVHRTTAEAGGAMGQYLSQH